MQSSNTSVYAVGDVAAFPVKMFAETRRLEHVDSARKSARHAVAAIMEPEKTGEFDYLPFFYSRVFTLSWQFYGDNAGEVIHFGDFSGKTFGAYWINKGHLVGSFLEGGTKEQYEAIAKATRLKPAIEDLGELERQGLGFALTASQKPSSSSPPLVAGSSNLVIEKPLHAWYATAGVIVAASVATFAYWYGRRRRSKTGCDCFRNSDNSADINIQALLILQLERVRPSMTITVQMEVAKAMEILEMN
ncbi:monodehydroascorbate reductase 4, peroxisomal-like [Coffea eugenioides]|uniref:monodehydroascorbate reductase 4, peroxisomal-like n=1 Tax=Coffea eugenioides TaxID=49369 RepID=UPI000F607B64|nr:monodehydroascorbate reductase 4, peroxisomal-like [Coffea eugenioides]